MSGFTEIVSPVGSDVDAVYLIHITKYLCAVNSGVVELELVMLLNWWETINSYSYIIIICY